MNTSRLLLVSNRLPFRFRERKGKYIITPSSGGLVSSMQSYIRMVKQKSGNKKNVNALWIGTSDIPETSFQQMCNSNAPVSDSAEMKPVFIPAKVKDSFYNGFCNNTIWPLFHYFPSYAKFSKDYFNNYIAANRYFCEMIVKTYLPGDIIWIHDYHLMLLPRMLRNHLPYATIGFFLHIPFPSLEVFRILPSKWRKDLLEGLLGADLVGFHTHTYVQHFLKSVQYLLGCENDLNTVNIDGRTILADTFPVSIDFDKFSALSENTDILNEKNKICHAIKDRKLIMSVDRLDYTKGIPNRLDAFELFLQKHPEYVNKVVYILVVVPSREIIMKYKENKKEIEERVSKINGKFGTIEWRPVIYIYKSLDAKRLSGLYSAANIALITPLRDGMNLVAKEFIASHTDGRGILVLSETAGASSELGEAITVNPTDKEEISDAIYTALSMPEEEQTRRMRIMQERLKHYDVNVWANDFISRTKEWKNRQQSLKVKELGKDAEAALVEKYVSADNRIIFLDYDGTLVPLRKSPGLAEPSAQLFGLLKKLTNDPSNKVVIISGRQSETLEKWFGNLTLCLVAEHGAFFKEYGLGWHRTVPVNADWKAMVMPLLNLFTERCAGTFIEEKTLSVAWHYRAAETELAFLRSRELLNELVRMSSHIDISVVEGHKVIEVRARGVDKGTTANRWLQNNSYDFIMALGDDKTDEDLFKVIDNNGFTIRVGLTQSLAKYNFKDQADVIFLLEKLVSSSKKKRVRMQSVD